MPPPRVDGKDVPYETRLEHKRELCDLRRVPPDAKEPRLCRPPRNGIVGHLREPSDKVRTPLQPPGLRSRVPPQPFKLLHPLCRYLTWGSGMSCRPTRACPSRGRRSISLVRG